MSDDEIDLSCPLCLEDECEDPRCLPCQHTFCKGCLQDYLNSHILDAQIECPSCRNKSEKHADAAQYPVNRAIAALIRASRKKRKSTPSPPSTPSLPLAPPPSPRAECTSMEISTPQPASTRTIQDAREWAEIRKVILSLREPPLKTDPDSVHAAYEEYLRDQIDANREHFVAIWRLSNPNDNSTERKLYEIRDKKLRLSQFLVIAAMMMHKKGCGVAFYGPTQYYAMQAASLASRFGYDRWSPNQRITIGAPMWNGLQMCPMRKGGYDIAFCHGTDMMDPASDVPKVIQWFDGEDVPRGGKTSFCHLSESYDD